jgi:hypothetical protein
MFRKNFGLKIEHRSESEPNREGTSSTILDTSRFDLSGDDAGE